LPHITIKSIMYMISKILKFIWLLSFISLSLHIFAKETDFYSLNSRLQIISVNEGLPQQAVTSITQDKKGFMWLGTYDGLCRYDGYTCNNYHHISGDTTSLSNNRVISTFEDSKGNIWIGTEGTPCLNLYNYDDDTFSIPEGQIWTDCRALAEGTDGVIWIGTSNGLFFFNIPDKSKRIIPHKTEIPSLNNTIIKKIVHSSDNRLWILTSEEIICLDEDRNLVKRHQDDFIRTAQDIYCDSTSSIFVSHPQGLYIKEQNETSFYKTEIANPLTTITQLKENVYIAGTEGDGIILINKDDGKRKYSILSPALNSHSFFSSNLIRNFYVDKSKCLWIGSGHGGIAIMDLNSKHFRTLKMPNREARPLIRSILKDSQNRLWIGIKLGGVYMLENDSYTELNIDRKQNFNAIFEDAECNIWICTNRNVYIYRNKHLYNLLEINGIPHDIYEKIHSASAIIQDNQGAIWIGGTGHLLRLKNLFKPDFQFQYFEAPYTQDIFCMKKDIKGNLWFGSRSKGIYILNLDKQSDITDYKIITTKDSPIKSNQVWSICPSSEGQYVWIATDSGMSCIDLVNQTILNIDASPKLSNSKIMNIIEDDKGELWLNTSQGLLRYNPTTNYYREYYYNDGLCSNATTEASFFDDKNNTLYIGTINGITYFNPQEIKDNVYTAAPQITSLTINNFYEKSQNSQLISNSHKKNLLTKNQITIDYHDNNFTLNFLAPDFQNPTRVYYAYILEGADSEWHYSIAQNRSASYNQLRAGIYTFRVRAANCDGIWSNTERSISIKVEPAPWNTWWAYTLYVLTIIGIILIIFRYYAIQYKLKKDIQIEHIQREHERILNDTKLKFHTNISHEIRTALTLISAPLNDVLLNNDPSSNSTKLNIIQRNVEHLNNLVYQFLDLRKIDKEAVPLQVKKMNIVFIIKDIFIRFEEAASLHKIDFNLLYETSDIIGYFDQDKVIKIISNLISNALKFTPEEGCVTVFVTQDKEWVELAVEDTGCGIAPDEIEHIFDRYYQNKQWQNSGMGIGLALVQHLVTLHKGTISVKSRPTEGGTIFSVKLPLGEECYTENELIIEEQASPMPEDIFYFESKSTIMIVEDNQDMREYLYLNLTKKYNVITACNVDTAMDKIQKHIPDLILLDIMLQEKSGLELCTMLKGNLITNHIPILILSAKASQEDIELGYSKGAEDYILKPFSIEVLSMKISNIILYRQNPSIQGSTPTETEHSQITTNPFMDKLLKIIEENIHNSEFGVGTICENLNISRTQLYRKIKATTDLSINALIRDYRMKQAYKLLQDKNYNISEVMYQVGINSNSYFTKTFREYYGILPSEYIKKRNNN